MRDRTRRHIKEIKIENHIFSLHILDLMRLIHAAFILLLALMTSAQCQQTAEDWLYKGIALDGQGKFDDAIQAYDKAIELDPQYADAWYNRGVGLISSRTPDQFDLDISVLL